MLALPSQTPGLIERHGLSRAQADYEAWVVEVASGRALGGAPAANRVLAELGGFPAALAALYRLPPIRWLEDWLYRWVADHRPLLSRWIRATPECDQPGVDCV